MPAATCLPSWRCVSEPSRNGLHPPSRQGLPLPPSPCLEQDLATLSAIPAPVPEHSSILRPASRLPAVPQGKSILRCEVAAPANGEPACTAENLGMLTRGDTWQLQPGGCTATVAGDLLRRARNPIDQGGFNNERTVCGSTTTGSDICPPADPGASSDPEVAGDSRIFSWLSTDGQYACDG